jgi:hypothetical protein
MDPDIKRVHGNQPLGDAATPALIYGQPLLDARTSLLRVARVPGAAPPMTTTSASIRPVHISGLRWLQGPNLIFMSWPGLARPMRNWL